MEAGAMNENDPKLLASIMKEAMSGSTGPSGGPPSNVLDRYKRLKGNVE
jgi:hypothetical protein